MSFFSDVRYAFRMLRKSPAFTAMAVVTMSLGIGATTLMFGIVRQVLLAPLPYPDSRQLVTIMWSFSKDNPQELNGPMADFFGRQDSVFDSTGVMFYSPGCNLVGGGAEPEYVPSNAVSSGYFRTLRVQPFLGRDFVPTDATNGTSAIISYRIWRDRFGSDPNAIGKQVKCNGTSYTVIGVLPASFRFYEKSDVWFTDPMSKYIHDTGSNYFMIGRLRAGLTVQQAEAQVEQLSRSFAQGNPHALWSDRAGQTAVLQPLSAYLHENSRSGLLLLFGAVVLVLLIASANIAGLLVARSVGRGREVAIRTAVGASRARLFSQLITESIVLNLLGGVAGIALAVWGTQLVNATISARFPEIGSMHLDTIAIVFAIAAAVFAGAISGLLPAWHVARGDTNAWMKHGTASRGQRRSRKVLVTAEVALALVLLSGSALLLRSFARVRAVSPGYDVKNLYAAEMSLGQERFKQTAPVARFLHDTVERLDQTPGLRAAAEAAIPMHRGLNLGLRSGDCDTGGIQYRAITPDFFAVMGIPLRQGRAFTDADSAPVAIVNERLASRCWPKGDAIGGSLATSKSEPQRSVIGIVGNTREYGLARPETPIIYVPVWQMSDKVMGYNNGIFSWSFVVRTAAPTDVERLVRHAVHDTDPEQAVIGVDPVSTLAGNSVEDQRLVASVMTAFGATALLLTVVGVYALLAYYVAERTREIGVRMALGAAHKQVIAMVVREGMALVGIGSAVGVIAAVVSARALSHQVAGLGNVDPVALAMAVLLLAVAAFFAAWLPARRAARIDPMVALRYE